MASRKGSAGAAETADESVAKLGISITVFGYVGVTVDTAATFTKLLACLRAKSRLDTTRAAPPSLVAQMSSRCSGSATTGDSSTSSTLTSLRKRALGLARPWRAFFTLTLAKSSGVAP